MWQVVAEEDIRCTECGHRILSGKVCLSQMPSIMPGNFRRRRYENFCIECAECDTGTGACYVRRLDHWYTRKEKTISPVKCGHCSETIPDGTLTVVQRLYAWPDSKTDSESKNGPAHNGGAAVGMAAGTAVCPCRMAQPQSLNSTPIPVRWSGSRPRSPLSSDGSTTI